MSTKNRGSTEDPGRGFDRRRLLGLTGKAGAGAAALAAAGYVGHRLPRADQGDPDTEVVAAATSGAVDDVAPFRTRSDLHTPPVDITRYRGADDELDEQYIFIAPYKLTKKDPPDIDRGPMIIDRNGDLVWFSPTKGVQQFRVQSYRGKPVLTWWQGESGGGYGLGMGVIADASYQRIATVEAVGENLKVDLHEFQLTERGSAYVTCYRESEQDLSELGGRSSGALLSGVVQEIDIASGDLIFEWDSIDHVPPRLSHRTPNKDADSVFDYFHLNSIFEVDEDTLLLSARNTWAMYLISKSSGEIIWTLGGDASDFDQGPDVQFHWQHDATMIADNRILFFDNAAHPQRGPQSRAMVLEVDPDRGRVELVRAYNHPEPLLANFLGSAQQLSNGDVFVGWGTEPYFSHFSRSGELKLDGRMPENVQSYRINAHAWKGDPTEDPEIAVGTSKASGAMVYASWNGATEVARWRVFAGERKSKLKPIATVDRDGFETTIPVINTGPCYQVAALGAGGDELRRSKVVKIKD